jgi:hypothetical protein
MAQLQLDQTGTQILQGVEANAFDSVRTFATTRTSDPLLADKLAVTYITIAKARGISAKAFIDELKQAGSSREQDALIAAYLNTARPQTTILGVSGLQDPPFYVAREIKA